MSSADVREENRTMPRSKYRRFLSQHKTALLLIATPSVLFLAGQWDFHRLAIGKSPIFAIRTMTDKDGGTTEYSFIGYRVTSMYKLEPTDQKKMRVLVGPKLDYWVPGFGRDETQLMDDREAFLKHTQP